MEGLQLGAYRIERKLGEGGMGVVYIGVDVRLGRRAAIKQLLPGLSSDRSIVERFFNEAKAAASINHPGIVEIYDVGWHSDGSAFFAMKLLEGDSLATRLRARGPMPIQLAATIARQIASALAAAHARGIVHRDLKPDNIVLVPDEEVAIGERATVLDFGIAKLFGDGPMTSKTRTGSVMGTPYYMSPEQCRGAGEIDHRTDVYALGCLVFEMLTGRPPFVAEGAGEILGMHQFVEPPTVRSLRADVPPDLEAVVMRALAKRAEQRPQTMAELTAALQPFATQGARSHELAAPRMSGPQPLAAAASHPGSLAPSVRGLSAHTAAPPRRRGLAVAIVVAVVAAAGIAIAVVALGGGQGTPTTTAAVTIDAATSTPPPAVVDAAVAIPVPPRTPLDAGAPRGIDAGAGDESVDDPVARAPDRVAFEALEQAIERNDISRAFAQWEKIPTSSTYRTEARELLAAAAREAVVGAEWARALLISERLLASYPRDAGLIKLAGMAACATKHEAKARLYHDKLAASDPARDMLLEQCRSSMDVDLGAKPAPIQEAPPPIREAPPPAGATHADADALNEAGKALLNAKPSRPAEAAAKFRQAISISPEGRFYLNYCIALHDQDKLTAALKACEAVESRGANATQIAQATKIIENVIKPKMRASGIEPPP